jgi:hypothetical protein
MKRRSTVAVAVTAVAALFVVGGVTGAQSQSGLPYSTGCRDAAGVIGACPPCPQGTIDSAPPCDFDGQPRIEEYQVAGCSLNTIPDAGADEFYAPGCEPYAYGVAPAALTLRLVSQTATATTLEWDPVPGADGFRFSSSLTSKRPHTWDGSRVRVTFAAGAAWYKVEALDVSAEDDYP